MGSMHPSDYALVALAFFYSLNLGPMMFETFTSDRTWASDPPDSFYMFRGPFGQKTAHYWRIVTPLAGAAFVLSLVLNWSAVDRRPWLFAFFVGYLAVQIPTMAYFVPEQEKLISDSGALGREALKARADRWIFLSYFRNVVGVMSYVFLLFALLTPSTGAWQGAPPQEHGKGPLLNSGRPMPFASTPMTRTPGPGGSMPAAGSPSVAGWSTMTIH